MPHHRRLPRCMIRRTPASRVRRTLAGAVVVIFACCATGPRIALATSDSKPAGASPPAPVQAAAWIAGLRQSVRVWLASLPADLQRQAVLRLGDDDRTDWHYTPRSRGGISFRQMEAGQREATRAVLQRLLSQEGLRKVTNIIELESVLRELESVGLMRDPERYHLTLYGEPASSDPSARWGLRFEGHHLSLNFTFAGEAAWSDTPSFLGANPARVPAGLGPGQAGKAGLRVLAQEEDLARALLDSLDAAQRARTHFSKETFGDIVTRNAAVVQALDAAGVPAAELSRVQQDHLRRLLAGYAQNFAPAIATERMRRVEEDFPTLRFAWAGSMERGRPHYYRVQGPRFLIEYDASQNGGNHIHTVWRDFNGDFGRDLLREHYQAMKGTRHGHAR